MFQQLATTSLKQVQFFYQDYFFQEQLVFGEDGLFSAHSETYSSNHETMNSW